MSSRPYRETYFKTKRKIMENTEQNKERGTKILNNTERKLLIFICIL